MTLHIIPTFLAQGMYHERQHTHRLRPPFPLKWNREPKFARLAHAIVVCYAAFIAQTDDYEAASHLVSLYEAAAQIVFCCRSTWLHPGVVLSNGMTMTQEARHRVLTITAVPRKNDGTCLLSTATPSSSHFTAEATAHSPLWMVTTEPLLNQFVLDLQRLRRDLTEQPSTHHVLRFSREGLVEVRAQFAAMIRHGEAYLHQLAQLLCASLLGNYHVESVVIGAVASTNERFTLTQRIAAQDVFTTTDLDLGTRQLRKLQFFDGQDWSSANLVANMVEYQPTEPNPWAVYRIHTRIKAEEEVWNKVVDELFDLDRLVRQDKALRHLSTYVKDIFGIKIVVAEVDDVYRVQAALSKRRWADPELAAVQIVPSDVMRQLEFIEVKDYLPDGHQKRSGWEAMKSVVRWADKTFELQIQPLRNFLGERELLTQESHVSFKAQREQIRQQVAEQFPLLRFYQSLLRWCFLNPTELPPSYPGITIVLDG